GACAGVVFSPWKRLSAGGSMAWQGDRVSRKITRSAAAAPRIGKEGMYEPSSPGAKLLHYAGRDVFLGSDVCARLWRRLACSIGLARTPAVRRHTASRFARRRVLHQLRA